MRSLPHPDLDATPAQTPVEPGECQFPTPYFGNLPGEVYMESKTVCSDPSRATDRSLRARSSLRNPNYVFIDTRALARSNRCRLPAEPLVHALGAHLECGSERPTEGPQGRQGAGLKGAGGAGGAVPEHGERYPNVHADPRTSLRRRALRAAAADRLPGAAGRQPLRRRARADPPARPAPGHPGARPQPRGRRTRPGGPAGLAEAAGPDHPPS